MGNEGSQMPGDGTRTPMSDSGLALGATPREVPRARRFSNASTQPPSPVDLDMSHLSVTEKQQIEAVIMRARELQAEEARRIREIEEEFGPLSASVPVNLSAVGPPTICPLCKDVELRGELKNRCSDCEKTVCLNCGVYDTNSTTKLQEWVCSTCYDRRHLATDVTMWCNGQQEEVPDFDTFLEMDPVEQLLNRGMKRTTSLPDSALDSEESEKQYSERRDSKPEQEPKPRRGAHPGKDNVDIHQKSDHKGVISSKPDAHQSHTKTVSKPKPIPPPKPDMSRRPSQESPPTKRQVMGSDDTRQQSARFDESSHLARTRGVGQSPDAENHTSRPPSLHSLEVDSSGQMLDEEEAISPGGTRRKQRPQHLILSRQHSGGSNASTSSSGSFEAIERDRPSGESSDGKQTDIHAKLVHNHKLLDIKSQTRTGAEGAEVIHVGTIKKKPSALGRAGISDHKDDRSLSPSRRSPKSPPRSPSWKRYRESPPRSPTMYSISPSMSPTERFPSTLVERTSPSLSREETYGEEYARDQETFSFDQQDMNNYSLNDPRGHFDRPPPKPARMSGPYQFEDEFSAPHTLDLAAYAATVASDTAHLTNMSVSPTCKLDVPDAADHHEFLEVSPEQESISPPSPNYFEDVDEEVDVNEPTPKSIDYQNTKRQRVKPPATDWSPVTDLSPIIDVSPSIERLEQEKMLEEQMYSEDSDLLFDSPPCTIKRRPKPQAANKPEASEGNQIQPAVQTDGALSPLKRYQAFHDISSICTPATNTNANNVMASSDQMPRNEEQTQVKILDANTPDLIHSVRAVNDKSKMANIDASNVSQPPQSMKDRDILRDTTSRPDLCTRQDSSSRDSIKLVQKHPSITRDMIINNNNIVTEAVDRRVIQKDDNDRRLPGSKSEENVTRARPALNNENKNNKYGSQKDKPTHPSLGDLERSSSGESSKSKDSTSSSSKVQSPGSPSDPKKTRRKLPLVPPEEAEQSGSAAHTRSQSAPPSRSDAVNAEKEKLRKRLQEREAEKRQTDSTQDMNSRNSRPGRSLVDKQSQTQSRSQVVGTMSSGAGLVSTGTNTILDNRASNGNVLRKKPADSPKKKPPKPPPKPKIDFVNIYGLQVPSEVKSLKQRIKEEIQIATTSRRLQIDEREEIRLMERELADREGERRQRAAEQARLEAKIKEAKCKEKEREKELEKWRELDQQKKLEAEKLLSEQKTKFEARRRGGPPSASMAALRMSPQASPRRARHKRQNSDPMVAKFSPIEEVRDIENELSYKLGLEARRVASDVGRFSPQLSYTRRHLGAATQPSTSDVEHYAFRQAPLARSTLSRSSEVLSKYSLVERDPRLASSQSESDLLMSLTHSGPLAAYYDEEDWHVKEERKQILQMEIEKRKRALEENARLQSELRRLSESADLSHHEIDEARVRYQQHMRNKEHVPTGIIKPIDYDSELLEAEAYSQMEYAAYRDMLEQLEQERFASGAHAHSHPHAYNMDYMVPHDHTSNHNMDAIMALGPTGEYLMADMWTDVGHLPPAEHMAQSELYGYPVHSAAGGMMHPYATPPQRYPGMKESDPLNLMYRVESDHSLADSDDNIMEGGVTLRRETAKKLPQATSQESPPTQQRRYDFPTKRILLTRDPKDRSVKGKNWNGIGMKIVGGKVLSGQDSIMGAYVSAIYPGGVADQLHGELQEGDQVLEWNGVPLTGKTYEEVQRTMAIPNGEIELVVRPGANLCSKHSATMSTLRSDSCHSSYDNLDIPTSDYEDLERYLDNSDGVDPDLLAAQLEDIRGPVASPGASPSSSQQEMYSMSTQGSSDPTEPHSPPVEMASPRQTGPGPAATSEVHSAAEERPPAKPRQRGDKSGLGEIQLQLSYDDYDGTLNIHVIQARDLRPKDKNGYSDPFVKVYLLPQRIAENKRRTKYIARTLDPEWHQTLVFMKISHDELVTKTLEITVWDYDRFKPNDFLGEMLIILSNEAFLDNKPHWYKLHEHSESISAKTANPPAFSPPSSGTSSTRGRGGGPSRGGGPGAGGTMGRGTTGRGGTQCRGGSQGRGGTQTRGGQGRGDTSQVSQGRGRGVGQGRGHNAQGQNTNTEGHNHVGVGRGHSSKIPNRATGPDPVLAPGPSSGLGSKAAPRAGMDPRETKQPRDNIKPRDDKTQNTRGPRDQPRDQAREPPAQAQGSRNTAATARSQTLSTTNQGASKYSPGLGRKPIGADSKERNRAQREQPQPKTAPPQQQQRSSAQQQPNKQQQQQQQQQSAQQQQSSQRQTTRATGGSRPIQQQQQQQQQQRPQQNTASKSKRTTVNAKKPQ